MSMRREKRWYLRSSSIKTNVKCLFMTLLIWLSTCLTLPTRCFQTGTIHQLILSKKNFKEKSQVPRKTKNERKNNSMESHRLKNLTKHRIRLKGWAQRKM